MWSVPPYIPSSTLSLTLPTYALPQFDLSLTIAARALSSNTSLDFPQNIHLQETIQHGHLYQLAIQFANSTVGQPIGDMWITLQYSAELIAPTVIRLNLTGLTATARTVLQSDGLGLDNRLYSAVWDGSSYFTLTLLTTLAPHTTVTYYIPPAFNLFYPTTKQLIHSMNQQMAIQVLTGYDSHYAISLTNSYSTYDLYSVQGYILPVDTSIIYGVFTNSSIHYSLEIAGESTGDLQLSWVYSGDLIAGDQLHLWPS